MRRSFSLHGGHTPNAVVLTVLIRYLSKSSKLHFKNDPIMTVAEERGFKIDLTTIRANSTITQSR